MERLGRLHLFDLATPESSIPSQYTAVEADEAKDVAVSIFRLGMCSNGRVDWSASAMPSDVPSIFVMHWQGNCCPQSDAAKTGLPITITY